MNPRVVIAVKNETYFFTVVNTNWDSVLVFPKCSMVSDIVLSARAFPFKCQKWFKFETGLYFYNYDGLRLKSRVKCA